MSFGGSMNFDADLLVHAPVDSAFAYLSEPKWMVSAIEELESITLEDGYEQVQQGAKFRQVIHKGGRSVVFPGSIETFSPPRELSVLMDAKRYKILTVYRLRENAWGTQMRILTRFFPKSTIHKWFTMLFAAIHRRQFKKQTEILKSAIERTYLNQAPPQRRSAKTLTSVPDEHRLDQALKNANLH